MSFTDVYVNLGSIPIDTNFFFFSKIGSCVYVQLHFSLAYISFFFPEISTHRLSPLFLVVLQYCKDAL